MKDNTSLESEIKKILGGPSTEINESYVAAAKKYKIDTELLSEKSKASRQ